MRKNVYITLIIILVVFLALMYFLFAKDNLNQERYSTTFLVGDQTVWNYSSRRWTSFTSYKTLNEINWKKFTVYEDNNKLGNFLAWKDDKWYFFTDNKEAVVTNGGKILAFNSNHNIDVLDFKEEQANTDSDQSVIDFVLKDHNLSTSSKLTVSTKINADLDNDQEEETIYCLSNAFATDYYPDSVFSFVVIKDEENIFYLYEAVDDNTGTNSCRPFIHHILDVNNDKDYEIIVSCGRYSIEEQLDMLFQRQVEESTNTASYKIVISNQ